LHLCSTINGERNFLVKSGGRPPPPAPPPPKKTALVVCLHLAQQNLVWHAARAGLVLTMHEYLARSKLETYRFMMAQCSSYTPTGSEVLFAFN
jgi:hypothetical protein